MFRSLLLWALFATALSAAPPNFVVVFADDLGYGDLGAYGHPTISTPHLDRLAREGQRWTQFYVGASVCTPSRAALLTGRLPVRSGMASDEARVLFPDSAGGLPDSEITIAEVLKPKGYATAAVGKWHLGHRPQYLPMHHGFDSYWGIPYSNDMDATPDAPRGRWERFGDPKIEHFNVPILHNEEEIERPADQHTITKRYAEQSVAFIRENRDRPFFLYLAHSMVHVPLFRSEEFAGVSRRGLYGDTLEEIDWSVGRILATLEKLDLVDNTVVVFTSDNGPWLTFDHHGGSAGPLRMGKGSTWDGGMRVPGLFWGPGIVKPGVVRDLGATMDLLPTFAALAEADAPDDRAMDGYDLSPVLKGQGESPRDEMIYYRGESIWAYRMGDWKAHFKTQSGYQGDEMQEHDPPLLFQLEIDPGEQYNVAANHPDVIAEIERRVAAHLETIEPVVDQLDTRGND